MSLSAAAAGARAPAAARPRVPSRSASRNSRYEEGDVDDGAAAATTLRGRKKSYDARADIGHWLRHDYA